VRKTAKLATANDQIILPPGDFDKVDVMSRAALSLNHPVINCVLDGEGIPEGSLFAAEPSTGALVKVRPDYIIPDRRVILDVKTTKDASPEGFARSCGQYRYDVQDALYTDLSAQYFGGDSDDWEFLFLAVENTPPFNAAIYRLSEADIEYGRMAYLADIRKYMSWADGYEEQTGYQEGEMTLTIPGYFRRSR
jgi:exodeoxyribonuclease VIII